MKGFMIYEDYRGKKVVEAIKLSMVNYKCTLDDNWINELSGIRMTSTQAYCNKDDTYDFEVGALISLMKMCGFDKSYKAIEEAFKYNSYDAKKSKELEEENEKLKKTKELEEEIKNLKKRINELEVYNNQLEDRVAGEQRGGYNLLKDMEKLQHEYDLCKNSENALKCSVDYLNKTIAKLNIAIDGYKEDLIKVAERCKELEAENEKLKLDCEMLQHGYLDTDMMFCGGRQNGKQYTFLVDLFKKFDQKKVDAAYKEAYNTTLPVWQKEVLNQMYGVYKESKEKPELPRTLDINGTVYRKSIQIKDFSNDQLDSLIEGSRAFTRKFDNEWLYKIPTKREEMWDEIFKLHKESDIVIKVKKEDVNTFLHEIEKRIPEIIWYSGVEIFETKYTIGDVYEELKTCDAIYFRLHKRNKLSYTSDSHIYLYRELKCIDYLPPMRWDLFKKGRLVVKVNTDNYEDFYNKCEVEIGRKPISTCEGTFTVYYSKGTFHIRPYKVTIPYAKKIVDWEDVR